MCVLPCHTNLCKRKPSRGGRHSRRGGGGGRRASDVFPESSSSSSRPAREPDLFWRQPRAWYAAHSDARGEPEAQEQQKKHQTHGTEPKEPARALSGGGPNDGNIQWRLRSGDSPIECTRLDAVIALHAHTHWHHRQDYRTGDLCARRLLCAYARREHSVKYLATHFSKLLPARETGAHEKFECSNAVLSGQQQHLFARCLRARGGARKIQTHWTARSTGRRLRGPCRARKNPADGGTRQGRPRTRIGVNPGRPGTGDDEEIRQTETDRTDAHASRYRATLARAPAAAGTWGRRRQSRLAGGAPERRGAQCAV